jgi:hypothetical protein
MTSRRSEIAQKEREERMNDASEGSELQTHGKAKWVVDEREGIKK